MWTICTRLYYIWTSLVSSSLFKLTSVVLPNAGFYKLYSIQRYRVHWINDNSLGAISVILVHFRCASLSGDFHHVGYKLCDTTNGQYWKETTKRQSESVERWPETIFLHQYHTIHSVWGFSPLTIRLRNWISSSFQRAENFVCRKLMRSQFPNYSLAKMSSKWAIEIYCFNS